MTTLNFEASTVLDLDWHRDSKYFALAGYQGAKGWKAKDWNAEETLFSVEVIP